MCGIAGILRVHPPNSDIPPPLVAIPEAWLDILDDSIKHRGPDGKGRFRDRAIRPDGFIVDVAFVHRRLSILDRAGGHQPMVSPHRGSGVIASTRASGLAHGAPWLLYESPDDPALHAWNDGVQRARSASEGLYAPLSHPAGGVGGGSSEQIGSSSRARSASEGLSAPLPRPAGGAGGGPSSDDLVAVVFNGCIYNHRDLRRELIAAGHTFTSDHSDTEVLVHGWREWGPQLKSKLEGMYALAIWDSRAGQVYWMRDRFGEKPLYIAREHELCSALASTPTGLIRFANLQHTNAKLLNEGFLRGWIQYGWNQAGPFADVGGALIDGIAAIGHGAVQVEPIPNIWNEVLNIDRRTLHVEEVDDTLRQSVHARLEADVPLATFLSGGIDSALITKYAAEIRSDLTAYTVRMPSSEFDESEEAQRTAEHLGVHHEVLSCNAHPASDLVSLIEQLGLPFGDSSLLPTTWVSRAARQRVAVALAGDGGDELFMGYDRHRVLTLLAYLERTNAGEFARLNRLLPCGRAPRSRWAQASRLLSAARYRGYKELVAIFPTDEAKHLGILSDDYHGWGGTAHFGAIAKWRSDDPGGDTLPLDTARRFDLAFYLPEDLLRKTDTASMSCALEVRAPFLDTTVSRAGITAEVSSLMPNNQRKGLLKQVARKYLPADIVDRPKQGFAIPIGEWFRSDFGGLRQLLLDHLLSPEPFGPDSLGINSMISMLYVKQMLKEHDNAGTRSLWPWKGRDHSQRLYMLLVLSIWAKWLGGLAKRAP